MIPRGNSRSLVDSALASVRDAGWGWLLCLTASFALPWLPLFAGVDRHSGDTPSALDPTQTLGASEVFKFADRVEAGQERLIHFPVEPGVSAMSGLVSWIPQNATVDVVARSPGGRSVPLHDQGPGELTFGAKGHVQPGIWTLSLSAHQPVFISADTALTGSLRCDVSPLEVTKYAIGAPVVFRTAITRSGVAIRGARVEISIRPVGDGPEATREMVEVSDGSYILEYTPSEEGSFTADMHATGTLDGFKFARVARVGWFEVPPHSAEIRDVISDAAVDSDGNGRPDQLVLVIRLQVSHAGEFLLGGFLTDEDGKQVGYDLVSQFLDVGPREIELHFSGKSIRESGSQGSFRLDRLTLKDVTGSVYLLDEKKDFYMTRPYRAMDFE